MDYKMGDIVRFQKRREVYRGLYEITGTYEGKTYHYAVTNNECDTELYVNKSEIMFVCSVEDRKDI